MALRGSLTDFSLPDVLQLVALSKKTGVLGLHRDDGAQGSIWFRDGDVFFAQSNWQREKLGARLIAAQKITESALTRALELHAENPEGRRIGQILVAEGYTSSPILEAFVQEQIQDTIFDLMRWPDGAFEFDMLPDVVDEDIGLSVSIENIVMEGSRRLEEWERLKTKVPSMDMVFCMATSPGEGGFEISLKPSEWNLLLLVDGRRSVADLARATGQTDFEVARVAYGLFSAGLLDVVEEGDTASRTRAHPSGEEASTHLAPTPEPSEQPEETRLPFVVPAEERSSVVVERDEFVEPLPEAGASAREPELPEYLVSGRPAAADGDIAVFEEMLEVLLEGAASAGQVVEMTPTEPAPSIGSEESSMSDAEPIAEISEIETSVEEYVHTPDAEFDVPPIPPPEAQAHSLEQRVAEPMGQLEVPPEPEEEREVELLGGLPQEVRDEPEAAFEVEGEAEIETEAEAEVEVEPEAEVDLEPEAASELAVEAAGEAESNPDEVLEQQPGAELQDVEVSEIIQSPRASMGAEVPSTRMDMELGGAISDEIAALTGAGRTTRSEQHAERSPEVGGAALMRDSRVDRATIEKILDAMKNL
jgi:hypothetical protein